MERRHFNAMLGALGITAAAAPAPEVLQLSRNGWMPNNERLPVLLYRGAITASGGDPVARLESMFDRNGWPAQWRNGVYGFHHYHSTAHEVLGFARGHARLILGGRGAKQVTVRAGDVAVLPVGTGHCRIESSFDFLVIGAYPPDQDWDLCRSAPAPEAVERMKRLSWPNTDPVTGSGGMLMTLWKLNR